MDVGSQETRGYLAHRRDSRGTAVVARAGGSADEGVEEDEEASFHCCGEIPDDDGTSCEKPSHTLIHSPCMEHVANVRVSSPTLFGLHSHRFCLQRSLENESVSLDCDSHGHHRTHRGW